MIFDRAAREFHGPKPRIMSEFDYLNSSSRPEAERVRNLLEDWCFYYPSQGRAELISRLRSRNDVSHQSAVFELTLHELVRRGGAPVTLHPELPGARGRPDFLVQPPTGPSYYLEATSAFETGDEAGQKRLALAYDILDRIESPNFFIGVRSKGLPSVPLKAGAIRRKLQQWLEGLDHGQLAKACASDQGEWAELLHTESGLSLVFTAIPKHTHRSGTRAIGFQLPEARWSAVADTVKSRLLDKVGKYGRPEAALVLAVNVFALSVDRDEIIDALFGHVAVLVDRETGATQPTRTPDGFWCGPAGRQNTRVSGVIWTSGLHAWSLADRTLEWVPNPWAAPQLSEVGLPLTRLRWEGSGFIVEPGPSIGQVVGLPAGWPGVAG